MDFFNKKIALLANTNTNIRNQKPSAPENTQKQIPNNLKITKDDEANKKQIIPQNDDDDLSLKLLTHSVVSQIEEIKIQSSDYIPKRVNKTLHMPVTKSSAEYKKVKEEIIANIEDGICELEYFNIDHAKEYVESALYYLKNIVS